METVDKPQPIVVDPHNMPRDAKGHFLPGYAPNTGIMRGDSRRGSELAARRQELAGKAARQALALKAQEQGLACSPVAAYGLLAGAAYDASLANLMDKPREGVEAGKFALRLAGMLPEADKQQTIGVAVQVVLAPEARAFVEGLWQDAGSEE